MNAGWATEVDETRSVILVTEDGSTREIPWTFDTANAWSVRRPTSDVDEANRALIAKRVPVVGADGVVRMVDPAMMAFAPRSRRRRNKRTDR